MWNTWKADLYQTEPNVGMPKCEMRYQKTLNDDLSNMGMPSAFGGADFLAIEPGLFIDMVIREAWIKVPEEGTEATAAPEVSLAPESASMVDFLYLYRPFFLCH